MSGSLCTSELSCEAGLTCAAGVCRPYCPASRVGSQCAATTGPGLGLCAQALDNGAPVPQDSFCFFDCTPSPNNCPAGQGCIVVTINATNYPNCQAAGTTAAGGACTEDLDCAAGTICYDTGTTGDFCVKVCRTTADCGDLGVGYTCDTSIGPLVSGVQYGLCHS